ncbi:MAG: DUF4340 domain-containing protein [Desulfobacterota bacterium]|jgi:hypothetical protein|nr:DUF4340 domain-containing protein [Thermodesulfobacteriota bacterium]
MKVKKEYVILVLLIIGLSLYLVFRKQDRTQYELPVLQEVPASEITRMEISKPAGSNLALERKNDGWILLPEAYPADSGKVSALLESIGNLTLTALVSESQNYDRYGLVKEEKIGVKAWAREKVKRDIVVGKAAPSSQHTFVLLAGDPRVFQARENLKARFDQTLDELRDKSVFKFDPSRVETIDLHDGQKALSLTRKPIPVEVGAGEKQEPTATDPQGVWQSAEGKVDEARVTQLLKALSNLKCRTYLYDQKKSDLKNPVYTVKVKGMEEHDLSLFAKNEKDKNDYPAVSSQIESAFLLSDPLARQIMLPLDQIVK